VFDDFDNWSSFFCQIHLLAAIWKSYFFDEISKETPLRQNHYS
jgi:hypothetical protein